PLPPDYEPPSAINSLIRGLLNLFQKKVYIAYTATPFANVLIPHDAYDPTARNDLYPKDFIIDLPKPPEYFGAEELFGMSEAGSAGELDGIDVVRPVSTLGVDLLEGGEPPVELKAALLSFVLSGAARIQRGQGDDPATMLVHASYKIEQHARLQGLVESEFSAIKNAWRYSRDSVRPQLQFLWEWDFRPVTSEMHPEKDVPFEAIEPYVGPFLEAVQIRVINSSTGAILDYEREPRMKVIAIGGNRLSRGLTLEGLTTSFFVRKSPMYDTLMQMGRWFGFRKGYEDLTRIWTTAELAEWFTDLAFVEHRLREDIKMYEYMQITPAEVGIRIWQHPTMQVTSYLKRRYAGTTMIRQSYSGSLVQTFKFPFDDLDKLSWQQDSNVALLQKFIGSIGTPEWDGKGPIWRGVPPEKVIGFLESFAHDSAPRSEFSTSLICSYIKHQVGIGELTGWTVSIRGREAKHKDLGETSWRVGGKPINQIGRSRISLTNSLGVITSSEDEKIGLSDEALAKVEEMKEADPQLSERAAARRVRPPQEGLLLIYPISRNSAPENSTEQRGKKVRRRLFEDTRDPRIRDLIGIAVSFPESRSPQPVEAYLVGTLGWGPYADES
ncbi:MAG: Z1 domain-containing protein, partial [Thermoplasmatales archaeon]